MGDVQLDGLRLLVGAEVDDDAQALLQAAEGVGAVVLGEPAGALVAVVDLGGEVVVLLAVALGVVGLDLEDRQRLGRCRRRWPSRRCRSGAAEDGATVVVRVAGAAESPKIESLLEPIRETP